LQTSLQRSKNIEPTVPRGTEIFVIFDEAGNPFQKMPPPKN